MKRILLTISSMLLLGSMNAQNANIQVIHNCADAAAAQVDVYLGNQKVEDNLPFRHSTTFLQVPAGQQLTFGVAPASSTSVADTIYSLTTQLMANTNYVAVANGIVSSIGYMPAPSFGLDVYAMGRTAASNPANTDLLVMHGSTDAPKVDLRTGVDMLVDDISYGEFNADYLELPTADYVARITTETGATTVQTYSVPLSTASLGGAAGVAVASGFLNPANNSNGPAFGIYVATPAGGPMFALQATDPEALARYQVIHNSADAAAASVDVYINGTKALDDFAFRTATEFLDAPANVPLQIGIAPATSTSVMDTLYSITATLDSAEKYILVANGIASPMGYEPAPELRLSVYAEAREMSTTPGNTDILVMHGSTDAPKVDVQAYGNTLVDNIEFGNFSPDYLSLPVNNYMLDVTDETGGTTVASYNAVLQDLMLGDAAITVVASGFLDPSKNSNGAAFGLYAATAAGGPLVALPVATSVGSLSQNNEQFVVWPNPAQNTVQVQGTFNDNAIISIMDVTGKTVVETTAVNKTIDISTLANGVYVLTVNDNGNQGFAKFVKR